MAVQVSGSDARSMKSPSGLWGNPWPNGEPAAVNGHEWAEFGPIGSTGGENWATFANNSTEGNWTAFSCSSTKPTACGECHQNGTTLYSGNQQSSLTTNGVPSTNELESDELDWQDFTSSDMTNNNATTLFGTSEKLESHLDCNFTHLETKPRSLSSPLPEHQRLQSANAAVSLYEHSRRTFSECFCVSCKDELSEVQLTSLSRVMDQRLWLSLTDRAKHSRWSRSIVEDQLYGVLFPNMEISDLPDVVDVSGSCEGFDWSLERERSVSPDILPCLFRPKRESLVDIEFDHTRAALGLAVLSLEELKVMCDEMNSKFKRLSDILITELQQRDATAHEVNTKNKFISALLKVQNMKHSMGVNGSTEGLRNRPRSWTTKGREEKHIKPKFLHTVIPYTLPEDLHWSISVLRQITKILQAISEDSDTVPSLVSEYLQSEVLVSPVKERPSESLDTDFSSFSV